MESQHETLKFQEFTGELIELIHRLEQQKLKTSQLHNCLGAILRHLWKESLLLEPHSESGKEPPSAVASYLASLER